MYHLRVEEEKLRYDDGKTSPVKEWVTTHDVTVSEVKTLVLMLRAAANALDVGRR